MLQIFCSHGPHIAFGFSTSEKVGGFRGCGNPPRLGTFRRLRRTEPLVKTVIEGATGEQTKPERKSLRHRGRKVMSTFTGSPKLLKGGIVLVDPDSGAIERIIVLQYNPDTLTRTLQVQGVGAESGDRLEAMRLKGPPVETFKLEAELDATDQLETPDQFPNVVSTGLEPQL